jgi:signal transduction histidine kinase
MPGLPGPKRQQGVPALRTILLRSIVALNLLAALVLALPLAIAIGATYRSETVAALEREATRALALTSETDLRTLPDPLDPRISIGTYDGTGTRIAGTGPTADGDAVGAIGDGVTRVVQEERELAVYVPFPRESGGAVTIRASTPQSALRARVTRAWLALGCLVLASVGVSAGVALRRARTLAGPFERLAVAAHDLRLGAFALSIPATGVREGDEVARALEAAGREASERVEAAQALAEDASHQVRTPLAAARVTLESALAIPGADLTQAATAAVQQLDRASNALAEVLALRRQPVDELPLGPPLALLTEAVARWHAVLAVAGRSCTLSAAGLDPGVQVPAAVLRQILDVLLGNCVQHGAGPVDVRARTAGEWLLVDVSDAGAIDDAHEELFTRGLGRGTGLGLALARSLAESVGGRLVLASPDPSTFTLALPTQEAP